MSRFRKEIIRNATCILGDSREVLETFADASIDSVVCDPPYALVSIGKRFGADNAAPAKGGKTGAYQRASSGFMGKKWDTGETAFDPTFWVEVLRVLRPGGHVLAFSGTRTYHRLACAIEDAGFEIRDMTAWLYGSGFPKSHDVSKGIDKANGHERPFVGVAGRGGPASIGAQRLTSGSYDETSAASAASAAWEGWGTALKPALEPICVARKPLQGTVAANILRHQTGALNIAACRIASSEHWACQGDPAGLETVRAYGDGLNNPGRSGAHDGGRWPANVVHDGSEEVLAAFPDTNSGGGPAAGTPRTKANVYGEPTVSLTEARGQNEGSAARFFYTAKADAEDRMGSKHPTVKPVSLMRWLCTLITPPGGVVLDPFAGTGSTGLGAIGAGFRAILIEREEEYFADIIRRFEWAAGDGPLTAQATAKASIDDPLDFGLFASQPASQPASRDGECNAESTGSSPTKIHRADRIEAVKA